VTVERVGVVGAGTMGSGIALISCLGGYETLIHDPDAEALADGQVRVGEQLARGSGKHWKQRDAEAASELLLPAETLAGLAGCDLVIEAAPEDLELKRGLFADLAAACRADAILATNTSSLRVADIAAAVPEPGRVVGMHFFNPPARMRLVEVVATERSSPRALEQTAAVAARMGRTPIRARDSPGFLANRLARPFSLESLRMLADGVADAEAIDRVCRVGGGFRMGPFELLDLIGLDVNLSVARSFYEQAGRPERWRPSPIQERVVAEGRLGRKSGCGFYAYDDTPHPASGVPYPPYREKRRTGTESGGAAGPTLDPERLAAIDPAGPAVLPRLVAQIANEAAFALEEQVGAPADMDTAMRLGFNWPLGPLELTELIGPRRAVDLLDELRIRLGDAYAAAPRLRAAAEEEA
jgi:3-hydroxybutyryl-CoA dehydrogenase